MINKRKYSVIVFDLGMVLLPFDYNIALERLENIEKGFGVNYLNHYKANYETHRQFERGDISEEEFLKRTMTIFGERLDKETFKRIYSEIFTVNDNVVSLLPELKKKYCLVLLSNTNSIHQEYGWKNYEFLKYFDKLILSHEVCAVKPEERIYRAVENFSGEPPEKHIFIDDIKEYAEAAIKLGWDGIQFTGYENLVNKLKTKDIL
ncbi:MAG TPA: HAD family phosphatase [Ignavibacteriaceae bacterium]|nr:HAD family phosphatase [Ignavibacteriaceae bacterium]